MNEKIANIIRWTAIGALGAALILTWCQLTWIALASLLIVGILDIILVVADSKTASNIIHRWFPKWLDFIIMVGIAVFTWLVWGPAGFLPVVMGIIVGHLFWHDD